MHFHKLAALVAMSLFAACAGTAARQNVLLPALADTWANGIRVQVVREAAQADYSGAAVAVVAADAALAAGDPPKVAAVNWAILELVAAADIERMLATGQIGPIVAESLRGRLVDFTAARRLYLRQNP